MKKAFLIGNAAYLFMPQLTGPTNDVQKISVQLERLGFDVDVHYNLKSDELYGVYRDYDSSCNEAGIVLFYFAGHGFQVDKRNYITPIDADFSDNFEYMALEVSLLAARTGKNKDCNVLVFIDACRDVPPSRNKTLYRSLNKKVTIKKCFYESVVSDNTLIMTSTNIGKKAKDQYGKTGLSPFAYAFLEIIACYTKPINVMVLDIQEKVEKYTSLRQIPTTLSSLKKNVYLKENTLPRKNIEFGRRVHSRLSLCCSDSSVFRASLFTSKRRVHADFPSRSDYACDKSPSFPLEMTNDRYSVSWKIPEDKEVTSICTDGYFFCCGTNDGWILLQRRGTLYGVGVADDEIWCIDTRFDLKAIIFSTSKGVFLDKIEGDIIDASKHNIRQLSSTRSLAASFGISDGVIIYSETNEFQETNLYVKSIFNGAVDYKVPVKEKCECYCLASINDKELVGATNSGLIFWDFSNNLGAISYVIKGEEESYSCLSMNKKRDVIVAATGRGSIQYWDVTHKIMLEEVKVCVSDTWILSLAWTETNAVLVTLSDETVLQIFNDIPEMPTEEYLLDKYNERRM